MNTELIVPILTFLGGIIVAIIGGWFTLRQTKVGYNKDKAEKTEEKLEAVLDEKDKTEKDTLREDIALCNGNVVALAEKVEGLERHVGTLAQTVSDTLTHFNDRLTKQDESIAELTRLMRGYSEDGRKMMARIDRTARLTERMSRLETINMEYTKSIGGVLSDVTTHMMEYISDPGSKAQFEKAIDAHKQADAKLMNDIMAATTIEAAEENNGMFPPPPKK